MKSTFTAQVKVTLKKAVLDPQGKAILQSLHTLGFEGVEDVRFGKFISLRIKSADKAEAEAQLEAMCQKLLANIVIEDFDIEISPVD